LRSLAVPQWDLLKSVARAAQSVMRDLPLIGWDIAPAETGPVIVEMNPTPDAVLNQISDRRGLLEPSLLRLAAQRKAAFKAAAAETKAELRKFSAFKA
jgi:glutathione synthase/RimK-type ligase-like ATP-grasp enzyme